MLNGGKQPPIGLLADVFGVSTCLVYQARRAARPHRNGQAHSATKGNGVDAVDARIEPVAEPELPLGEPVKIKPAVLTPTPTPTPPSPPVITDAPAWVIARTLVRDYGPAIVFDNLIAPAIG
jgi:hypothetical protein